MFKLPPSLLLLPTVMSYFCSLTDCLFTCQGCGCCCILWCGVTLLLSPASDLHSSCPLLAECHSTCPLHCLAASCAQCGHLPRYQLTSPSPLTHQLSEIATPSTQALVRVDQGLPTCFYFSKCLNRPCLQRERRGREGKGEGQQFCLLSSGQFVTFCWLSPPLLPPPSSPSSPSSPLDYTVRLQTKSSKIFEELGSNIQRKSEKSQES